MGVESKHRQTYGKKVKIRRKIKNWGQLILGTITGLFLGLLAESNIFFNGMFLTNSTCFISSSYGVKN